MADDLAKPDRLYERDYLAWTMQQAQALRSRNGDRNVLDHDDLAEEIEDLGKSELRACESQLENIIEHLLKLQFDPPSEATNQRRKEVRAFRRDLNRRRTPSMDLRLKAEVSVLFADVLRGAVDEGVVSQAQAVMPKLMVGYAFEQLIDPDWYPAAEPEE